jgi:hypothetical protein
MDFLTVRELTTSPREAWKKLAREGEIAITNQGKPTAIMLNVADGSFDETVRFIRQARFMRLLNNVWEEASERGPLSDSEIEAEITGARAEIAKKENIEDNA